MPIVWIAHLAGLQRVANELVQVSFQSMKSLVAETNPARRLPGQVADWPYGFESAKANLVENIHHDCLSE